MNKIGIDFGTTFCTASRMNPRSKQPEALIFQDGGYKMHSMVYYAPDRVMVGLPAFTILENSRGFQSTEQRNLVFQSVIEDIKRNMKQGQYIFLPGDKKVSYEEVIAAILRKIREEAQVTYFEKEPVEAVTITHPVVFASWQKEMIKKAAELAGFKEVSLLEEPVAAAIGYVATTQQKANNILVYDFGGGTFDIAFVHFDKDGEYRIPVEPEGEAYCGGNDIDEALYDKWEMLAKSKYNRTINENPSYFDKEFKIRCRRQKENMALVPSYSFSEILPPPGFHRIDMEMDQKEFNRLIEPIIDKTIHKTKQLLKKVNDAGFKIDTAIMIGGSSRIPLVYEKLKAILPVEPKKVMQIDVAVALGAVVYKPGFKPVQHKEIYCIYCGRKISTADKFCIYDGKKNVSYIEI